MASRLCRVLYLTAPNSKYGPAVPGHHSQSPDLLLTALTGKDFLLPGNFSFVKALRHFAQIYLMDKPVRNQQDSALSNASVMLRQLLSLSRPLYVGGRDVDHSSHMAASILILHGIFY